MFCYYITSLKGLKYESQEGIKVVVKSCDVWIGKNLKCLLRERDKQRLLCSKGFILFQVVPVVKNPPANAGDVRDLGSIPGLGRSPGEGHGHPLQYSCLENPMDRGAWRATAHGATKSGTPLKLLSTQAQGSFCP